VTHPVSTELKEHLQGALDTRVQTLKAKLAEGRRARNILDRQIRSGKITYKIVLVSLWADHGDKAVMLVEEGNLEELMKKAIAEFMKINRRSDVQANYSVYVLLKDKTKDLLNVPVPEEFWRQYKHVCVIQKDG
jgi:hypothetical protein